MNKMRLIVAMAFAVAAVYLAGCAENKKAEAAKPYPLQTCLVCDMKLSGMGQPYVFVYQGQEIKVCDKSEKAEFDKDPDKYMKKLAGK
jgi:nitrous oxide reductase accessory protein NosL